MGRAAAAPPREMRLLLIVGKGAKLCSTASTVGSLTYLAPPFLSSALVYIMLCCVMLLLQSRTTIELVHTSSVSGYRARLLREAGEGGGGVGRRTMAGLLGSQMFREQEDKLKWIALRIERYLIPTV